MQVRAKRDAH